MMLRLNRAQGALAIALVAYLVLPAPGHAARALYVSGVVILKGSGSPVSRASVSLYPIHAAGSTLQPVSVTETSPNGSFVLTAPSAGQYRIVVLQRKRGISLDSLVTVPAAGLASLKLQVEGAAGGLHLQILGTDGNLVRTGGFQVRVLVLHGADHPADAAWDTESVDTDGTLEAPLPTAAASEPIQAVGISVRSPDLGCGRTVIEQIPAGAVPIQLIRGAALRGQVTGTTGLPAPGTILRISGLDPNPARRFLQGVVDATADDTGRFEVPFLLPGLFDVAHSSQDDGAFSRAVNLPAGVTELGLSTSDRLGPTGVDFTTKPSGSFLMPSAPLPLSFDEPAAGIPIVGSVTASGGARPVAGAGVGLMVAGQYALVDVTRTDSRGVYHLTAPMRCTCRARVT